MSNQLIQEQEAFEEFCRHARDSGIVAFDTEFISEHTYRPELCLLQFATDEQAVAADPFELSDLSPWWDIMCDPEVTVIVHGGQAEVRFCLWESGNPPQSLIDVQLAEGMRSRSYPLGYAALVNRVLQLGVSGKATRTDWKRRPLSDDQIRYAIEDVKYLPDIWRTQLKSLTELGRAEWVYAEFDKYVTDLTADDARAGWVRLPGINRLSRRELAVAINLYEWRDQQAQQRNKQPRRVLRDDLLLDIARRKPKTTGELMATRDMNRSDYRRSAAEMLNCVEEALAIPKQDLPVVPRNRERDSRQDEQVLGKLLSIALANRCAEMDVSMQLVATSADLRQLVRRHVYKDRSIDELPLLTGWRATVCGDLLTDVLDGHIVLKVADPESDHPLVFIRTDSDDTPAGQP